MEWPHLKASPSPVFRLANILIFSIISSEKNHVINIYVSQPVGTGNNNNKCYASDLSYKQKLLLFYSFKVANYIRFGFLKRSDQDPNLASKSKSKSLNKWMVNIIRSDPNSIYLSKSKLYTFLYRVPYLDISMIDNCRKYRYVIKKSRSTYHRMQHIRQKYQCFAVSLALRG